jgi:hypothetical protein
VRVDELDEASPLVATPPGAGARRASAAPVRVEVLVGMRLCVDLNSPPENIGLPDALVGPDDPFELLELPEDPELPLEDDVPPPEPDELEDPVDEDDDPVVVRGTA